MKIQELGIIFIIIIIPISIVLSVYTQFQINTLNTQTLYDTKLTTATVDAIKAFQLNTVNSTYSELSNSKLRDIEASIATFKNSIMSIFELNGYTQEEIEQYIPALVYTMYDGFYIYSPYENTNYLYEYEKNNDGSIKYDASGNPVYKLDKHGNKISINNNEETVHGLKPYITYSCRYKIDNNNDFVITYALDNYIQINGTINGKYIYDGGYLVDGITVNATTEVIKYNGIEIQKESLTEYINGRIYPYIKINGTKYYYNDNGTIDSIDDEIFYLSNGIRTVQGNLKGNKAAIFYKTRIQQNNAGQRYYKDAYEFTKRVRDEYKLGDLKLESAYDEVILEDGTRKIEQLWPNNKQTIFTFDDERNIEEELSNFNKHRLEIIRHKIETNLSIAIANYNNYSGTTTNDFQMPELKEEEWNSVLNNISLISFLQGLNIGGKNYNGYTIVNNTESKEVILEESILILGKDGYYHQVGDKYLESGTNIGGATFKVEAKSSGRLNLDFKRKNVKVNGNEIYYYPIKDYYASYDSIVTKNNVTLYENIYEYIEGQNNNLKEAFYTALGRERKESYNAYVTNINNGDGLTPANYSITYMFEDEEYLIETYEDETRIKLANKVEDEGIAEFFGWESIDEPGKIYPPGDGYTIKGNTTMIAKFNYKKYSIIYDTKGGTPAIPTEEKTWGVDYILSDIVPTKERYQFMGWLCSANGQIYYSNDSYKLNINTTMTAQWKKVVHTVEYNANGGIGGPEIELKAYGETISNINPTKTGYKFLGWAITAGGNVKYKPGEPYAEDSDKILYAVWEPIKYKITYIINKGKLPSTAVIEYTIETPTFNLPTPTGTNYVFKGWYDNSSYTGTKITNIPKGTVGDKTFYANEHVHTGSSSNGTGCYTKKVPYGGSCGGHYYEVKQWYCGYCGLKVSSRKGGCGNNACSNTDGENPGKNWARTIDSGYKKCSKGSSKCGNWKWQYRYELNCGW